MSQTRNRPYRFVGHFILIACFPVILIWLLLSLDHAVVAQGGCLSFYEPGNGWELERCTADPNVDEPMAIVLNGQPQDPGVLVRIYHQQQDGSSLPQVAVIYASGFVRLKQNANPAPVIPFGSSFILGPAYWSEGAYHHTPQLTRLEIDTSELPTGPLRMRAEGENGAFDVTYQLTLPPPRDRQTRLHVMQEYTATTAVSIDFTRRQNVEGFKVAQISSMFINEDSTCDGGHVDCHDSNGARFIGDDLQRYEVTFAVVSSPTFLFSPTISLGSTWLDALHTDNQSWQGNTPNVRIALDTLPTNHTITPQGWITPTTDPNNDNVSLWLHDDGPASENWTAGQHEQIGYWLLAQDDPVEPWADLGLRSGEMLLDFEEADYHCRFVKNIAHATTGTIQTIAGYTTTALQLDYDLGSDDGNWVQIRCNFDPPLDLSASDHLRFDWRGDPDAANSLEIGLINPAGDGEKIFGRGYHHVTHRSWWGQLVIPLQFLEPWTEGVSFDSGHVSAFFVSVVKDNEDDVGGTGRLAIDSVNAFNVISRTVPDGVEPVKTNVTASERAVNWLLAQQRPNGLLKSWEEEENCYAYTYDQALALLVFADSGKWAEADAIVAALASLQNEDGSWPQRHLCDQNPPAAGSHIWEGDVAWAVYALSRYLKLGGSLTQTAAVRDRAAGWLVTRINPDDGCLVAELDHTEATIDVWWALQSAWPKYDGVAKI